MTGPVITAMAIQAPVSMEPARNAELLLRLAAEAPPQSLVVAPEGMLSGYSPHPDMTSSLDRDAAARAIERTAAFRARPRAAHHRRSVRA